MIKTIQRDFMECESCIKKLGSPILCGSCIHNRSLVSNLNNEISTKSTIIKKQEILIDALLDKLTLKELEMISEHLTTKRQ